MTDENIDTVSLLESELCSGGVMERSVVQAVRFAKAFCSNMKRGNCAEVEQRRSKVSFEARKIVWMRGTWYGGSEDGRTGG